MATALAFLLLAQVGKAEPETQGIVLKVQGLPNEAATDPAAVAEQKVLARFQEKHPHVQVQSAEGLRVQNMNSEATTMMMIAGGIAPDVIRMQFRSSDTYIRQGIAAPLDGFIQKSLADGDDVLAGIPSQLLPVLKKRGPDGVEHIFGLPSQLMVSGLYFNRELFRKAGLPARAPRDWPELIDFSRKIRALGPSYHGLTFPAGSSSAFHLMNFVRAAGADAVMETSPGEWRAAFNSPGAVDAYILFYQLVEAERLAYRSSRPLTPEEMRTMGMVFRYVGDTVQIDPEIWGVGAVPYGPQGANGSEINSGILAVFSGIEDPARKQAAWDYIRFVTSDAADRIRVDALVDLGQASLLNPTTLRKFGYTEHLILTQPGLEEQFSAAMKEGRPEPYGKNCNLIYTEMTYPLDQILLSRTIRDAWNRGDKDAVRREVQQILDHSVIQTNERMVGFIEPEKMQFRRKVTAGIVGLIVLAFVGAGIVFVRTFSSSRSSVSRPVTGMSFTPWLCLLPAAALTLVWEYLPLLRGTQLAFLDYHILLPSVFVGLDNFANVLFNAGFWRSLLVTAYFVGLNLTLGFAAPILLAYLLHLIPRHKVLFRTLYYLPAVISGTAVYFLWGALFDTGGILNQLLRMAGFEARHAWTQDPYLAMFTCIIPGIWATTGPGCLIYLAALKTIPEEQFEAAEIDGAGFCRKTINIVFPGLKALIIINFVGAMAAALQTSANILIMTGGGPNGATEVVALRIFFEAFTRLNFGQATAMSWIIGSLMLGFTVLQLKRLGRMEFKIAK